MTVVATDNNNSQTISEAVNVTVEKLSTTINQLPVVSISSPGNNSTFEVPVTITLTADATDPDGTVSKVEYFNGNIKIGESYSAPFTLPFEIKKAGSYDIIAIATDNLNAIASSSSVILYANSDNQDFINLYPNPNDGRFTINLITAPLAEKNMISVINLTGETVYQGTLQKEENIRQFDLSYLKSGAYVLMISNNKIVITETFFKK